MDLGSSFQRSSQRSQYPADLQLSLAPSWDTEREQCSSALIPSSHVNHVSPAQSGITSMKQKLALGRDNYPEHQKSCNCVSTTQDLC